MEAKPKKELQYRVITFLSREELDYLDEVEKDIFFTYGIHIPRAKLVEEIIDAFKTKDKKQAVEELLKDYREKAKK